MTACKCRVGGPRVWFDRVWRNCLLGGKPCQFDPSWALPKEGILELDFVQITKVGHTHHEMSG